MAFIRLTPWFSQKSIVKFFPAVFFGYVSLVLLEVSWISAMRVVIGIVGILGVGKAVLSNFGFASSTLGMCFIVGSFLFVLPTQILLLLGFSALFSHQSVLLAQLAYLALHQGLRRRIDRSCSSNYGSELVFMLAISILALSFRHPWLLPYSLPLFFWERLSHRENSSRRTWQRLALTGILIGWFTSDILRPVNWWFLYQNGDASFFESISWSTSHWGVSIHPGDLSSSLSSYHWFVYALYGGLTHLADLGPWVALMQFGLVLNQMILVSLLLGLAKVSRQKISDTTAIFALFLILAAGFWRVDSASFGVIAAIGYLMLAIEHRPGEKHFFYQVTLFAALALVVTLSKATTSLILGSLLFLIFLRDTLTGRGYRHAPFVGWALSSLSYYLAISKSSRYERDLMDNFDTFVEPSGWNYAQAFHELFANSQVWLLVCALFLVFSLHNRTMLAKTTSIHGTRLEIDSKTSVLQCVLVVPLALVPSAHLFLGPAILISLCLITAVLLQFTVHNTFSITTNVLKDFRLLTATCAIFLFAVTAQFGLDRLGNTYALGVRFGELWTLAQHFGILILWGLAVLTRRLIWRSKPLENVVAVLLTIALLLGASAANIIRANFFWEKSLYTNWPSNQSPFPTSSLIAVGKYIDRAIPQNAILASNDFCCFGIDWWYEIESEIEAKEPKGDLREWTDLGLSIPSFGGDQYNAAAASRRKFLLLGLAPRAGMPSSQQIRMMRISLEFANRPSREVAMQLKAFGVTGYLVNLSLTDFRDWSEFAIEKFRSGDFLYLELR